MSHGKKKPGGYGFHEIRVVLKKGILISWFIDYDPYIIWRVFHPLYNLQQQNGAHLILTLTHQRWSEKKPVTCQITPHLLRVQMHLHSTHVSWNGLPEAEKPRELWTGHSQMWEAKEIIPFYHSKNVTVSPTHPNTLLKSSVFGPPKCT